MRIVLRGRPDYPVDVISTEEAEALRSWYAHSSSSEQDAIALAVIRQAKLRDGWTWGPRMSATQRVLQDGFARASAGQGTLLDAVRDAQRATMPDLIALGLATTEHSS